MNNFELLMMASPDFFESLAQLEKNETYKNILMSFLPEDWLVKNFDIWCLAQPSLEALAPQGFKIHVSATRANAEELLRIVIPQCVKRGFPFKFMADPRLLSLMNSKNTGRSSSAKAIVVYPPNLEAFKELIEVLYELTRGLEGPYILSDARYKDSKVLYYRYGGFWPTSRVEPDGSRTYLIRNPNGEFVPDERHPYFTLPEWIEPPFPETVEVEEKDSHLLNGRYDVLEALSFSNGGGVYKANDTLTGATVVIKEARPLSNFWQIEGVEGYVDAPHVLRREYHALKRLAGCPGVVRPVDFFTEWEHSFLVEEFVEGMMLINFRSTDDFIVIVSEGGQEKVRRFSAKFRTLAQNLLAIIRGVHAEGFLLVDISPNNFIVDTETLDVTLIDLETSIDVENPGDADLIVRYWSTPGFRTIRRQEGTSEPSPEDDYFALGMVLFSLIVPIQGFFELEPPAARRFIADMEAMIGLPLEVKKVIEMLLDGRAVEAYEILEGWEVDASTEAAFTRRGIVNPWEKWGEEIRGSIREEMQACCSRIADFLLSTFDTARHDRLWPADVRIFETNPLSIACGAAGPLMYLKSQNREVPEEIFNWLGEPWFREEGYSSGLYWGLSGIAIALEEIGLAEKAQEAIRLAIESPLRFAQADICHGAAGVGWSCLWFHRRTGDSSFLEVAKEAGENLLQRAEVRDAGYCWRSTLDDTVHFGFSYGASGICLFLMELYRATGDERFRKATVEGLNFELSNAVEPDSSPSLRWFNSEEEEGVCEPYWERGSAGIGSVLLRCGLALDEPRFVAAAERAAKYAFGKYAVVPGQFTGLSGIGEFMLDLYLGLGREIYLNQAYAIADTVLMYAANRPNGVTFPGRLLLRFSNDFSTGSAGVGLFLNRLVHLKPRPLLDLGTAEWDKPRRAAAPLAVAD